MPDAAEEKDRFCCRPIRWPNPGSGRRLVARSGVCWARPRRPSIGI